MDNNSILSAVNTPADLKRLDKSQLLPLCDEIRAELVKTVSKNGGHLASNLGMVELTVALHRKFNSPIDKIVFDVGHQCYTHKMLTGRKGRMYSLRKKGGLSGFPRPTESEHDAFSAGHSSTSISAAYGISMANSLKKKDAYTIAVIGDGAISGGLAYEALNNAGRSKHNLIVILNDNKMSISKNVGAMARYLSTMRSRPNYYNFKVATDKVLSHIPLVGTPIRKFLFGTKSVIKNLIFGSNMFECLGFAYLGPIDGHDLDKLDDALTVAKTMKHPVFIHISTQKGKGYVPAEKNPNVFHGISSFDIETGEPVSSGTNFSEQFGLSICDFAANDKRICAITAAMCESTGLSCFAKQYKQRFFDVGIAEQHAVTFAAGLASNGMIPIFCVYSTFLQRSYDQILHDAALQNLKVIIGIDRAGVVGDDGETHQGIFDVSFLLPIPNVTVYAPVTYEEMRHALKLAIYNTSGVVAIRYPRGSQPELPDEYTSFSDNYDVFGDQNADIAVVTYGRTFKAVINAAERLKNESINIKIIKLGRIKPIDEGALLACKVCKKVFFFEEGMKQGGLAEHFASLLFENGYKGDFDITAIKDEFLTHASVAETLQYIGLDESSIYEKIAKEETNCRKD